VLGLGIIVKAVVDNGLSDALHPLLRSGTALPTLLAVATLSAVLANLINNLPAVLVLLPLARRTTHPVRRCGRRRALCGLGVRRSWRAGSLGVRQSRRAVVLACGGLGVAWADVPPGE